MLLMTLYRFPRELQIHLSDMQSQFIYQEIWECQIYIITQIKGKKQMITWRGKQYMWSMEMGKSWQFSDA